MFYIIYKHCIFATHLSEYTESYMLFLVLYIEDIYTVTAYSRCYFYVQYNVLIMEEFIMTEKHLTTS